MELECIGKQTKANKTWLILLLYNQLIKKMVLVQKERLVKMFKYISQMAYFGEIENKNKNLYWRFQNKPYSIHFLIEKKTDFHCWLKNFVQHFKKSFHLENSVS